MDNRDYPKVRREAVRQGWRVESKRNGELFLAPDGRGKAMWHFTPSDHRALNNLVRHLKASGFVWPPPKR